MTASRNTLWWAALVTAAVFGPYASAGAMTGQVALLASAAFVLVTGWPAMTNAVPAPFPVLGLWCGIITVTLIATLWRPADPMFFGSQPASHALAWLAVPVAALAVTWYWSLAVPAGRLMLVIARVIAAGMSVNALLAAAQMATGNLALWGLLPPFQDAGTAVTSVAAENGRYTGIFVQPAEAGLAYGIALLCVIYLARTGLAPRLAGPVAALLAAGGVLTISKVFLLGAVPVAAWAALRSPGARGRLAVAGLIPAGLLLAAGKAGLLPAWPEGARIATLAHPSGSLAGAWTAGRYGPQATLGTPAADVLHVSPAAGFGVGGLAVPYDSQWLEMLALAGVMGVVLTVAVFAALAWRWLRLRRVLDAPERALAGSVLVLAAGASLGIPSLTASRGGIIVWLVLGVLLTARHPSPGGDLDQ